MTERLEVLRLRGTSGAGPTVESLAEMGIREPRGSEDPSTAGVDEEHRLLPDGKLLHVTYWEYRPVPLRPGLIVEPALQGWQQIRATSPFQSTEAR